MRKAYIDGNDVFAIQFYGRICVRAISILTATEPPIPSMKSGLVMIWRHSYWRNVSWLRDTVGGKTHIGDAREFNVVQVFFLDLSPCDRLLLALHLLLMLTHELADQQP